MAAKTKKMVVTPIDGSRDSLRSLEYLRLYFAKDPNLKIHLLYIMPTPPSLLVEECKKDSAANCQLEELEKKNRLLAEKVLTQAREKMLNCGVAADRIEVSHQRKETDVAHDICRWAGKKRSDAIVLNTHSRSRIEAFFMGETARKVLEFSKFAPVWLLKGSIKSKKVMIALDSSENAMRAVDHAGFILSGTDCSITLFHSKRKLQRFLPKELLAGADKLEQLWKTAASQDIAPAMEKAKAVLIENGFDANSIQTKIVEGSSNPSADILKAARQGEFGTFVMGRKGVTDDAQASLGGITRKVLQEFDDMALWIVR